MNFKPKSLVIFIYVLGITALLDGTLLAESPDEIASVNGAPITVDEFQRRMDRLTREGQGNFDSPEGKEELLDILISREVLNQEGLRLGVDKKKEVKDKIDDMTKEVIISEVVNQIATEKLTDAEIKKYYDKNKADFREVHASHILVKEEAEANEIKKKLDKGADFAALAKEKSIDPGSAQRGGDLGFFTKDRMVKQFADAAFSLKVNEISKPVHTPFGYHIIKVVEVKDAKNFEELAPANVQGVRGTMINIQIDQMKEKAKVKVNKEKLLKVSSPPPPPSAPAPSPATQGHDEHKSPPDPKK